MAEKLRQEEEPIIEERSENKQSEVPENISRRKFLSKVAAGVSASTIAENLLASEISAKEENVDFLNKQIAKSSFEGRAENAPGIGLHEQEALMFQYMMLPRNEKELKKYQEFLEFIHGEEFRKQVADQLTILKVDPKGFDEKGWEFYKKYFGEKKMVKIEAGKKISGEDSSCWSNATNTITIDIADQITRIVPPSVTLRHETDHATQESKSVDFNSGAFSLRESIREIVSFFDGVEMALIDKQMRGERGLSPDKDEDGRILYTLPIKFPSGKTYRVRDLLNLSERFFDMQSGEGFQKTFVEILAHPSAMGFFENLIYGDMRDNGDILNEYKINKKDWDKKVVEFGKNPHQLWEEYIDMATLKSGGDGKYRKQLIDEMRRKPLKLHQRLVMELEIDDDPIYAFYKSTRTGIDKFAKGGPQKYSVTEKFIREKGAADVLRAAIVLDKKVGDFWMQHELVSDKKIDSECV